MKLLSKMKKTLALTLVAATIASPIAVFAHDYEGHWAQGVITKWVEAGYLAGFEDGEIKPDEVITRAQFAQILMTILGLEPNADVTYTDVDPDAWYAAAISAVGDLMNSYDGAFNPNGPITREEAAYALARAFGYTGEADLTTLFTDAGEVSGWAREAMEALVAAGIFSGYPDQSLQPGGFLTRAELVSATDRAIENAPAIGDEDVAAGEVDEEDGADEIGRAHV